MKQLHPPQVAHVDRLDSILANRNCVADMSKCGLGKTVCAAELARRLKRPFFVVAPLSTLPAWRAELADRGVEPIGVVNYEKLRSAKCEWTEKVGGLWRWKLPLDAIICYDEAQKLKSIDSIASKIAAAARPYSTLLLSGSLAENPMHMRTTGFLLGLHHLRDFWTWAKQLGCTPAYFGGLEFNGNPAHLDRLHRALLPERASQMSMAEMSQYLPKNKVLFETVDFGDAGKIAKIYANMERELLQLATRAEGDQDKTAALIKLLRARQQAELLKVPLLAERAEALADEGNSVVVFLNFTASLVALSERLGGIPIISGKHKNREEVITAFREDKTPILAVNVAAGGVGVNLQGARPRSTLLTPSFNPIDIIQALGRTPRVGGADCVQHILTAAGTVEEQVSLALEDKLSNIDIINEGLPEAPKIIIPKIERTIDEDEKIWEGVTTVSETCELPAAPAPTIEPAHAEFGPSSLSYMEKCPGYRNRGGTTERAEIGNRIHAALEKDTLDVLVPDEKHVAQVMTDYMDSVMVGHLPKLPDADYRELRVSIDLGAGLKTFGTGDRLLVYGDEAHLFDYKTGYRAVPDAEINPQGFAYTLGAFQKPKLQNVQKIHVHFLIPNRDELSTHTFTRADMPRMLLRLNTIVRRAMAATEADFNPQPELCEYCFRQATCPALARKALPILAAIGEGLTVPANPLISSERPEDIPHLMRLAPLMEAWATGIRAAALKLNLEEGLEIDGFQRIERSNPRAITSVLGAWGVVKDKGIDFADFLKACSKVSMPQLEDLVASLAPSKKKGIARKELELALRDADILRDEGVGYYLKERKK